MRPKTCHECHNKCKINARNEHHIKSTKMASPAMSIAVKREIKRANRGM
jgi:hypothetical protein